MAFFVKLTPIQRKNLFLNIKEAEGSWEKFYPNYKISRTMFFNYLSGKYFLPLNLFNLWKKIGNFQEKVEILEKKIYLKKELKEISLDGSLAEIFGVLNGDGHISKTKKEICIVGNKNEKDYALYLKDLFSKKLGIDFNLFIYGSCFKLKGYSVKLSNFFIYEYGLPKGNKLGKLHIPKRVLANRKFLIRYLKGLFDTDGTFYLRRKNEPVLEISNADNVYLKEICEALILLGFSAKNYKKHISLYRREEIVRFFNMIKPANSKHLKKFKLYSNS